MSNIEGPTSFILVQGSLNSDEPSADAPRGGECVDYLRTRHRAEKRAAEAARTDHARRVHLQLADHYSRLVRQRQS